MRLGICFKKKGKAMKKLLALVLALACIVCCFASCGGKKNPDETVPETTLEETIANTDVVETEVVTDDNGEALTNLEGEIITEAVAEETETETAAAESTTAAETKPGETTTAPAKTTAAAAKKPTGTKEILAAYTAVVNQVKKDAPAFKKTEYQELPTEGRKVSEGAGLVNAALKLAGNFMTTKEDCEVQDTEKGSDMHRWPLSNSSKGCLLTNTAAVKSATCSETKDGYYVITMTFQSEMNPEPVKDASETKAPSNHGGVFDPVSKKEIDDTLTGNKIITIAVRDITYSLKYHDCEVKLTYDPKTNRVINFAQTTHVSISGQGTFLTGGKIVVDNTELVDYMNIYDIKY